MKFTKKFLCEIIRFEDVDVDIIANNLVDSSRWSLHYDLVFKYKDKYYLIEYEKGSTEYQDRQPFGDYKDEDLIECTEVEPVKVTVTKYVPITTII